MPRIISDKKAMPVLKKVISYESRLMRSPKIPVNPQMRTMKWRRNWYFMLFDIATEKLISEQERAKEIFEMF